ncbi:MAG: phosphate acyltransferase PlsX [Balneolaceae bacterium]
MSESMIIAVDAAGGDYYPKNPVVGALEALNERDDLSVLLAGPESMILKELEGRDYDEARLRVVDAPEVITMKESPSSAVKGKRNSSIVASLMLQKEGTCQGFVSSGNTGALLAASVLILGKLPGVLRPTIATSFPTLKGNRLLLDAGANLEVKPEIFLQFAKMGTIYCRDILGVDHPTVGLMNVGEEEEKGTELLKETYPLLKQLPNFIGNIEGRDIFPARSDIFLCDGMVGNILLKFGESIPESVQAMLAASMEKMDVTPEIRTALSELIQTTLDSFNYENVGGVPFLGVNGVSLVGHGGSSPRAIKNMILQAARFVDVSVNQKIVDSLN